jgi:hypothetical protein
MENACLVMGDSTQCELATEANLVPNTMLQLFRCVKCTAGILASIVGIPHKKVVVHNIP